MNDITFQLLLLIMIHFRFMAKVVNIKTALLYRELERGIHMDCPPGMKEVSKDDFIILQKCIYSLV